MGLRAGVARICRVARLGMSGGASIAKPDAPALVYENEISVIASWSYPSGASSVRITLYKDGAYAAGPHCSNSPVVSLEIPDLDVSGPGYYTVTVTAYSGIDGTGAASHESEPSNAIGMTPNAAPLFWANDNLVNVTWGVGGELVSWGAP